MRKVWMGATVAAVLGLVALGWQGFSGDAAATMAPIASAAAQTMVQVAQNADQPDLEPGDHVLGSPDAPITIIEYASLTCPHCAHFHNDTLPQLESEYIDKGRVRLIFRDFPLDRVALRASMLAECMPEDRYFNMIGVLFRTQSQWARSEDPMAALEQLARTAGLSTDAFDQCMANESLMKTILTGYQEAQSKFDVRSTPTFIVNGTAHAGALSFEEFQDILEEELSKS